MPHRVDQFLTALIESLSKPILLGIPLEPGLKFTFSTPVRDPIIMFENISPGMIDKALTGLTLTFSYTIP